MAWKKPRHRKSGAPVVERDYSPQLSMPGVSDVVELKEEPWSSIIKGWAIGLIALIVFVFITAGLLYSAVSATLFTADKLGQEEHSLVVRSQWRDTGGKPPVGAEAVVSLSVPLTDNPIELVKQGWTGIPGGAVVRVLTNDHEELRIDHSAQEVTLPDGTTKDVASNFGYEIDADPEAPQSLKLNRQYLVECVTGVCEPGTTYIIGQNQIYGKQRGL